MVVGDKVMMTPTTMVDELNRMVKDKVPGTVVYIHPRRRFYTVEFRFGNSAIRESFPVPLAANVGAINDRPGRGWHKGIDR